MDKVWRFFRTVGWGSVGVVAVVWVVIPALQKIQVGDWPGLATAVVIGGLTVVGAGLLAFLQALIQKNSAQSTALQRALYQFGQMAVAGLAAPVLADTLFNTAANYGRSLWFTFSAALIAGVQAFIVNRREALDGVPTPAPVA